MSNHSQIVLDDDDDEAVGSQASQPAAVQPPASSAGPADLELQLLVPRRRTSVVQARHIPSCYTSHPRICQPGGVVKPDSWQLTG